MSSADVMDVASLIKTLKKEQQRWTAKETWLNQLSRSELKAMMGAPSVNSDVEFYSDEADKLWAQLPKTIDWRNKDGKNWVSPILNQGACGSCVAFAAIGTLETQINISSLIPNLNVSLSMQQLFSCGGGVCGYGWYPESAAQFLKKSGVVDQSCMPYISGITGKDLACNQACPDAKSRVIKIADYKKPTTLFKSLNAVKKALLNGPLMTSMTIYEDFLTYGKGIYKHSKGRRLGGHAVSIVGYDDNKKAFIIRNSWGVEWGEAGFAYMDYKDVSGIGAQTWSFEVPAINSVISVESPRDRDYISGNLELKSMTNTTASQIKYTVIGNDGSSVASLITPNGQSFHVDTTNWTDGKYQVRAQALDGLDRVLAGSTYQYFYVVNRVPEISVNAVAVGFDATKKISGRVEFDLTSKSSSVPMTSMEFHFKDQSGKDNIRITNMVLNSMRTGWRTNLIPNGEYEVWFTGRIKSNQIDISAESAHFKMSVKN